MNNIDTDYVVEVDGLTKRFGSIAAVNKLTLQIPKGGVFGLLGPNGSGKTTTISLLLGLIRPTAGHIRLFGNDVKDNHQSALHRVGAIVETPAFYPNLSGRDNLRYFQGIGPGAGPEELDNLLDLVDLSERADSKFKTYSLGMKQRLGIAYALLGEPELIFLDEPTNGLDPSGMAEVRDLISRLGSTGHTIVLSSHLLNEVELICDYVAILSKGELITQGKVSDLINQDGAVRLKTTDDDQAYTYLASLDWVSSVKQNDGYLVAGVPADRSGDLTKVLSEQNLFVTEMHPLKVTLEHYFLEVTENARNANDSEAA